MSRRRNTLAVMVLGLGLAIAGWLWLGDAGSEGPHGLWLLGDGEAVRSGLRQLADLEPAPIAGLASVVEGLEDCERIAAHLPTLPSLEFPQPEPETGVLGLVDLFEALRCASAEDALPDFAHRSGSSTSPGGSISPGGSSSHSALLALAGGGFEVLAQFAEGSGPRWSLEVRSGKGGHPLLVAVEGPPEPLLDGAGALAHLQFATDGGLDLSALQPKEGGEGHVFNLRGEALGQLLLGDVWELVLLPAEDPHAVPPPVMAVEVTSRRLATAAMNALLDEGREVWSWAPPVRARLGDAEGECLEDLRLLPSMAPCWVVVERGQRSYLVLGWNRKVTERALSRPAAGPPGAEPTSWAWVDLDQMTRPWVSEDATDRDTFETSAWPWVRLEVAGRRVDDVYTYELSLVPRTSGP